MNLVKLMDKFPTEEDARLYLEQIRWPNGVKCLRCGCEQVSRLRRQRKYGCVDCEYQFSVKVGTIFHDSRIGIRKWLIVIYMMTESKKGVAALQIKRMIDVSYPTAWYMCHRIRNAMQMTGTEKLAGIIEIDETYVGPKSNKPGRPGLSSTKAPVLGMIERGGKIVTKHVQNVTGKNIKEFVDQFTVNVEVINTDEFRAYNALEPYYRRKIINHSLMYSDGDIHVNSVENFWSLLKRGIVGTFHKISVKHLHRYLNEFTWRFNNRKEEDLFTLIIGGCEKLHAQYSEMIA